MAITLSATPSDRGSRTHLGPMMIIGLLFFIFGFLTWFNGPLITFVKLAFQVSDVAAFLVPSALYLSHFFLSLPASLVLRRTGMKRGMALGLFVMAIGAVLFGQFVSLRVFAGALAGLFVIGAGLALLIMSIAGGAVVPQLFVHLKQHVDFQLAFLLLMVPCYLYILYYGLAGHRVGQRAS